jgi:hypothetical protein
MRNQLRNMLRASTKPVARRILITLIEPFDSYYQQQQENKRSIAPAAAAVIKFNLIFVIQFP